MKHSKKYQIDIEELGKVKLGDDVREQKAKLTESW